MVTNWEDLGEHLGAALKRSRSVARRVHASSRGLVDYDDLVATGYEWIAAHQDKVANWHDDGLRAPLDKSLYRAMQRAVLQERTRRTGARAEDSFYYSAPVVEDLLPSVWSVEERTFASLPEDGQPRSQALPGEGNSRAAALADVARAVSRLPEDAQRLLRSRFESGMTYKELASLASLSGEDVARKRVNAAVQSIVDLLGGETPWRGRRPRGNAQARAVTAQAYEGGSE